MLLVFRILVDVPPISMCSVCSDVPFVPGFSNDLPSRQFFVEDSIIDRFVLHPGIGQMKAN